MISVRDYPAEDLILGRYDSPAFELTKRLVERARGLIVATPVYQAAYAGALKALLDILPTQAFRNKIVLPIATGGSLAHLLFLDYALKPVLGALGASDILPGVYVTDGQLRLGHKDDLFIDREIGPASIASSRAWSKGPGSRIDQSSKRTLRDVSS